MFWSLSSGCQLLLCFGQQQLHVHVAKLFHRGMSMLVRTLYISIWSTVCFCWIWTNLYFCSSIKIHLRKSDWVSTSFLIYSVGVLMLPHQGFRQQSSWSILHQVLYPPFSNFPSSKNQSLWLVYYKLNLPFENVTSLNFPLYWFLVKWEAKEIIIKSIS